MNMPAEATQGRGAVPAVGAGRPAPGGLREQWPGLLLMATAFVSGLVLLLTAPPILFSLRAQDVWFEADVFRVLQQMSQPRGALDRAYVHPVFSLVVIPLVLLIKAATGLDGRHAVAVFSGLLAAGIAGLCWMILRRMGRGRLDAFLVGLLLLSSSTWMFWFSVTETYPLGGLTILLALLAGCIQWKDTLEDRMALLLAGTATFFATITNGMFGLALFWLRLSWRRFLLYTAAAFLLTAGLFLAQRLFFSGPDGGGLAFQSESKFVLTAASGGPLHTLKVQFLDAFLAPKLHLIHTDPEWTWLSLQRTTPGSGSPWGAAALAGWAGLLGLGAAGWWRARSRQPVFCFLLLTGIGGQALLHAIYGEETFLYAFHILPLLVLVAGFAFEWPRLRIWVRIGTAMLAVAAAANNGLVLRQARACASALGNQSVAALTEKAARPQDDWPRGKSHLVLGRPGAEAAGKAFMEPGGSFSPSAGSFGVSFWVTAAGGRKVATGDSLPLSQTSQTEGFDEATQPCADFSTPFYHGRWTMIGPGRWQLRLEAGPAWQPGWQLWLMLRGIGPAAGPLNRIEAAPGETLLINQHWRVRCQAARPVTGADESIHGLDGPTGGLPVTSPSGWAYARVALELPAAVEMDDGASPPPAAVPAPVYPGLKLPDPRFVDCLRAQITQLAMAGQNSRLMPFDPYVVPYPWARPSAYAVAALARSGNVELARPLALELAAHDFYGPYGAEADGPGLSLWAIEEVAARADDPAFDARLWPAVQRKAGLIEQFARAGQICYEYPEYGYRKRFEADVFARNEVRMACLPAEHGLIAGRIEHKIEPMRVTAASYQGLRSAAALARRLGDDAAAGKWSAEAARLQQAWVAQLAAAPAGLAPRLGTAARVAEEGWRTGGFYLARDAGLLALKSETRADTLSACALWPTWIGAAAPAGVLPKRLGFSRPPASGRPAEKALAAGVQMALARAHQALWCGDGKQPWETLESCWSSPLVPGAYVWGDDWIGKTVLDHPWENYRGYLGGGTANPSLWDSAEMLCLQLDMLAYLDESAAAPVIVIGAGVPGPWLAQPLAAAGLSLKGAQVDWTWDRGVLRVTVKGRHWAVRPAGALADCKCEVAYADR